MGGQPFEAFRKNRKRKKTKNKKKRRNNNNSKNKTPNTFPNEIEEQDPVSSLPTFPAKKFGLKLQLTLTSSPTNSSSSISSSSPTNGTF